MKEMFDRVFDECIDRINRGDSVESCLVAYPDYAAELKPLLEAVTSSKKAYTFKPGDQAKSAAFSRLTAAIERGRQPQKEDRLWLARIFGRRLVWTTLAVVTVAVVGIYIGVSQPYYPVSPVVPESNPEGNFVFLISDEVNAIDDFESVDINITKLGLFSSENGGWIEFKPDVQDVDLTTVKGDNTQQVWRGNLPEGEYTKVFIYVGGVQGILKDTGEVGGQPVNIKLPGNKLHLSITFTVSQDVVTSFIYDLTVISTGNGNNVKKYLIKPQATESGAESKPANSQANGKPD